MHRAQGTGQRTQVFFGISYMQYVDVCINIAFRLFKLIVIEPHNRQQRNECDAVVGTFLTFFDSPL